MRYAIVATLLLLTACDRPETPIPTPAPVPTPEATLPPAPAQPVAAPPAPRADVEDFAAEGMLIDAHALFAAVARPADGSAPAMALVTAEGVYSFIETPDNQRALAAVSPPAAVSVRGKVHHPGRLLHADAITPLDGATPVDLDIYRTDAGQPVTLTGVNKCQCGIKIAELHTTCALGHLHHLEAEDGKLYHYLRPAAGADLHLGRGSHFKTVTVEGRLLPGQFLLITSASAQ